MMGMCPQIVIRGLKNNPPRHLTEPLLEEWQDR